MKPFAAVIYPLSCVSLLALGVGLICGLKAVPLAVGTVAILDFWIGHVIGRITRG